MSSASRPALVAPVLALAALGSSLQMAGYRLAGSDAGAMVTAAAKILNGGVFYRDIDSYPFPGAAYLLALVMQLFGETLSVARTLAAVVFVLTVLSLYAVALRLLGPSRAALYGASLLAFKLLAWPSFTAYSYWDVAFAFGCAACAALVWHRPGHGTGALLAAGLLTGFAATAKQSLGVPLGLAVVAVLVVRLGPTRPQWLEAGRFVAAAAAPLLAMTAYFASQGLLQPMIESGLLRPFSDYLPTSSTSFFEPLWWWRFGELRELPGLAYSSEPLWAMLTQHQLVPLLWSASELLSRLVYTSVPIVFALSLWRWARELRQPTGDTAFFAFVPLALAIFSSAFPRADFSHVISVYPVVLLLLFALRGSQPTPSQGPSPKASRLEIVAVAAALSACLGLTLVQQGHLTHDMKLERAELTITPDKTWIESAARFVAEEIQPGEPFFVYGHEAYYYFLTDRYSPWRFSQLYPGQGGGDGGAAIVAALEKNPPRLIIRGATRFPRATPIPDYLPKLDAWINSHYKPNPEAFNCYPPKTKTPKPRQFQMLRLKLKQ